MNLSRPFVTFDPRSKLATIILASVLLTLRVDWKIEMLFVLLMLLLLALNGGLKKGIFFCGIYFVTLSFDMFLLGEINGAITAFFSFIFAVTCLLIPPLMAASFAMNHTRTSEWIASMKKMNIPMFIIIPFSVVCRFFPVLISDFKQIRQIMKFRGIGVSSIDMFRHPFLTMEYILVPILTSVEITSIDLSAAALVRGLGNEERHSSIYDNKFKNQDYVLIVVSCLFLFMGVFFS